ncbi:hypothetical protein C3489_19845 [Streptomyces sp. Ru71]|uniref:hypothetical protein n=1 Tax=Streptomyces sp. Ru71 TaxID=2080746 RepID=UPI000CDDC5BC|nr:hypothetical protein [Streptomyces sp. Ru71]POX51489.1 hypothetical protein C3489_19845 [Streptomyces sp. Ru71]
MATWVPEPGETLLARDAIVFATGTAPTVSGKRWFRDHQRHDIQGELPGWPDGPEFVPSPETDEQPVRKAGMFGLRAAYVLVGGALEALGGTGSFLPGAGDRPGRPQDPDNEVHDFPVMWATRDGIARTLPWQLDPGRCPDRYRTHAVVTDRRLLVLGLPGGDPGHDEVLWQVNRAEIARVERMRFSGVGEDAKIQFVDGSWCRLAPPSARRYWTVLRHLAHPTELVPLSALTPRQRAYVESYVTSVPDRDLTAEPVITRRPSGKFLIEVATDEPVSADSGVVKQYWFMNKHGGRGAFDPGDL